MGFEADRHPGYTLEENYKKALTELVMLFLLSEKDCHISELTASIHARSHGVLTIMFPYGAIYRLEQSGHIRETGKRIAPDGRRRQYIEITDSGRVYLRQLLETYRRISKGFADVLGEDGENEYEEK